SRWVCEKCLEGQPSPHGDCPVPACPVRCAMNLRPANRPTWAHDSGHLRRGQGTNSVKWNTSSHVAHATGFIAPALPTDASKAPSGPLWILKSNTMATGCWSYTWSLPGE